MLSSAGGALAGTLQTANTGIEKVVAKTVADPNIRYLIITGKEIAGHMPGDALISLVIKDLDSNRRIMETDALKPCLLNISMEAVHRFIRQITIADLTGVEASSNVKKAHCGHATRRNQQSSDTIGFLILERTLSPPYATRLNGESLDLT